MLSDILSLGVKFNPGALSLLLFGALWLWYAAKQHEPITDNKLAGGKGVPPTFPYVFPFIGSLPIAYLLNPRAFLLDRNNFFQSKHPVRVRILNQEFYVVGGADNVKALFKGSWVCTSIPFVKFALGHAFGLPAKALSLFDKDDSGGNHAPHPDSKVEARNRIDYRVHESLVRFLEGKGLLPFWNRFTDNITQRLHAMHDRAGSNWDYQADLMQLVGDETTISVINALCGPHLLALSPDFLQSFWNFDRNLQTYLRGTPSFLAPKAYADRRKVLDAVKTWQQHARDHFTESAIGDDGDDPFWGCSFFRERQKMFLDMDGFDHAAIASQDFGAIWAARNAVTATSWSIFDIYRDPELLASLRAEVDTCKLKNEGVDSLVRFDIDRLLRLPVLQAVYAETLRLRMHFYIIRMPDRIDLNIQDWVIPRKKVIVTPTTVAHMDAEVWCTGEKNEHPVDKFWAGRFLKCSSKDTKDISQAHNPAPTFSTREVEGSWIPYGGGPRQCPGRHFAKRQILLTIALMVSLFDCEILEEGLDIKEDFSLGGFGGGVSHPTGKVPIRIRRRIGESDASPQ
ncbi:putative NACHT and Ankyrin domain protein [Rosellinia necatrix]|uniref:Putative NACHT and Ankyrin domain protein n=1 Tax=Rosellinia necatrix TaxID=77044 RepID=A0A1W2TVM4_ROSNE|nr:putative NACHT and Ankyrin domain protein [Rosellinia necatrix]